MVGQRRIPIRRQTRGELIGGIVAWALWVALIAGGISWLVISGTFRPLPGKALLAIVVALPVPLVFICIGLLGMLTYIRELRRRAAELSSGPLPIQPGPPSARWNAAYGIDPDVPIGNEDRRIIRETYDFHEGEQARRELRSRGYEICIHCGFWLRGLGWDATNCPECGQSIG